MYVLEKVKFQNIGVLGEVDVDIHPGLSCLVGPNGCGKSTFLRGLMYALTGIIDGEYGKQTSLKSDGSALAGKATVVLSDGNKTLTVTRGTAASAASPDKLEIQQGGETTLIKGRKQVDAFLASELGVSMPLLFILCWARQGRLDSLLTSSAAVISEFLRAVFDLKQVEKVRDDIKTFLLSIPTGNPETEANLAKKKQELEEANSSLPGLKEKLPALEREVEELGKELVRLAAQPDSVSQRQKDDIVFRWQSSVESLSARVSKFDAKYPDPPSPPDHVLLYRVASVSGIDTEQPVPVVLEQARKALATVLDDRRKHADFVGEIDRKLSSASTREAVLASELAGLSAGLAPVSELLEKYYIECPVCGGHVDDVEVVHNHLQDIVRTVSSIGSDDDVVSAMRDKVQETEKELLELRASISSLEERKANEQSWVETEDSVAQGITAVIDSLSTYSTYLLEKETADADRKNLETARAELGKARAIVACETSKQELLDSASRQKSVKEDELRRLRSDISYQEASVDVLSKSVSEFQAMLDSDRRRAKAIDLLTNVRTVLSAPRAQARFMAARVARLNANLAYWLEKAGLPFTVSLDEDERVFVQHVNGFDHPAAHLSGAQKSITACALLLALADVVSPNIRLFLFDEPGEALDSGNKAVMADSLQAASRALDKSGTTIVVTRDQEIIDACENNIELGNRK